MKVVKVTPLRLYFESDRMRGTKTEGGFQVVPTTPKLLDDLEIILPTEITAPNPLKDTEKRRKLHENLREYQYEDVLKLSNRAVGMLLSEPRTGKTPTAISVFKEKGIRKFIVVCPNSITYAWKEEIERWYPGLKAHVINGSPKKRAEAYGKWEDGALVLGYERLRVDEELLKKHFLKSKHVLIEGIIIDEAHKLKNYKSKTFKAISRFMKIKDKLFLSGTITPNLPEELYGPLKLAYPQIFHGYYNFIEYYFNTYKEILWEAGGQEVLRIDGLKREEELLQFLDNIGARRTQKEVMPWLTELIPTRIKLECTPKQIKYIKELTEIFETEDVIVVNTISALTKIRQVCLAPVIAELEGESPKLDYIKQYIKDFPDEKIVIFSNSTKFLNFLSEELGTNLLITGQIASKKRDDNVKKFQSSEKQEIMLVNIKAGKEGITLDEGNTAIFTDIMPPAADFIQAKERITNTQHDSTNLNKKIILLSMEDTWDDALFDLVESNIEKIDPIINYKEYLGGKK